MALSRIPDTRVGVTQNAKIGIKNIDRFCDFSAGMWYIFSYLKK